MQDLIYFGDISDQKRGMLELEKLPGFKFTSASDSVNPYRVSIECELDKENYIVWTMKNGLYRLSFNAQMTREITPKKYQELIDRAVVEINQEKIHQDEAEDKEVNNDLPESEDPI